MDRQRCTWCLKDDLYMDYHDNEWGIPSHDDQHLFEHLILETFQAGLSWHTILKKRENFRIAFDRFNANKMARYDEAKVYALLQDEGIIRHRKKIEAAINNAQRFLDIVDSHGSFDQYIWSFTDHRSIVLLPKQESEFKVTSPESDAMSKDMRKRGFKFVGSTTCYAYMQAVGMVIEHMEGCWKNN